jgi:hypothetical protein
MQNNRLDFESLSSSLIIRKEAVRRAALVYLPVTLLFFEYQISWQFEHSSFRFFYGLVIVCLTALFIRKCGRVRFLSSLLALGAIACLVVVNGVPKALASTLIFAYGYCVVIRADRSFSRVLIALFLLNSAVVLCQVLGLGSWFYRFQTYSENWQTYISFLTGEKGTIPVHQQRVSGIFPSTIYLSLFQILIFGQLTSSLISWNKNLKFVAGVIFSLIGSTVSLMLFLFSFPFLLRKRSLWYFQFGFLFGALLLATFLPDLFALNYDWADRFTRVNTRFVDSGGHSVLTASLGNFLVVLAMLGCLLLIPLMIARYRKRVDFIAVAAFLIVCVSPMIVHDIVDDIRFWFVVGTACAHFAIAAARLHRQNTRQPPFDDKSVGAAEASCPSPLPGSG